MNKIEGIVRWGIIGCGDVTEVKSGPGFQKAEGSALVAVMRRDEKKAADYARRHDVPRWYADADALIADPEVNAVYIATPPGTHEQYAMKVAAAGKPCYVEKPMSRNAAEARRMVAAFADRDLPLFAAYYRRALPRFIKVKQLLDAGALGRLHTVRFHYASDNQAAAGNPVAWRFLAEHAGGGLFMDMGPHPVDLFDFWFGPLKITQASAGNKARAYAVEDHIRAQFTAPGLAEHGVRGIEGAMTLDFAAAPADAFLLAGDAAELRFSCFGNEPLRLRHADGRSETFDLPNPPHVAQPLIQTVVNALRGTGECPGTAASALRAQQVMDDILNDYYGGREDHFWTRPWPGVSPKG